jgi:hypothetical protein
VVEGIEDLLGFGGAGVIRVDVDPPHGVGGVKDESGGHRQGFGAVGVDVGRIESELELGGTCFRRWPG